MRLDQTARSVFLNWSDLPAAILWYGAETRPVAPDRSNMVTTHNLDRLFGGSCWFQMRCLRKSTAMRTPIGAGALRISI
jgi:hypothetical protein